jgi:type I restriction enzyme, R subunit
MLDLAGWSVQNMKGLNFTASRGVAIREFPLKAGFADYMLFVDRQAVGIVEAKKEGTSLSGVDTQSRKYLVGLPAHVQRIGTPLPFAYESTGVETMFRDVRDPDYRSRRDFSFHRPETLLGWAGEPETLRARLKKMPPLETVGLRRCQVEAIEGLERLLAENRPRSLVQMATGNGKTGAALRRAYRLIKHAGTRRVVFLGDQDTLGSDLHQRRACDPTVDSKSRAEYADAMLTKFGRKSARPIEGCAARFHFARSNASFGEHAVPARFCGSVSRRRVSKVTHRPTSSA